MKRIHLLITAGPTREPIDPVRFISNYSTGFLGYALAKEAKRKGYKVTLISGPVSLKPPKGIRFISVKTALEMYKAVKRSFSFCDCLIMNAAVCDFQAEKILKEKIKKENLKKLYLKLKKTPDILWAMGKRKGKRILVGFSLESKALYRNAFKKLKEKKLDLIIAQRLDKNPFGEKKVSPIFIYKDGSTKRVSLCSKIRLSKILLKEINALTFRNLNAKLSPK